MRIGCDGDYLTIDWEPQKYKTKAAAAKALYRSLRAACERIGMNPDIEVSIFNPEQAEAHGYVGKAWHVIWESGPYDWGVSNFFAGPWGYCEPYWGFDLAFYE